MIGTNPRFEAPLLNSRLRKSYIHNDLQVALIGPKIDLRYDYNHLGTDANVLKNIVNGSHPYSKCLKDAKRPLIIIGSETLERNDGGAILSAAQQLANQTGCDNKEWKVLNVLHKVASQVAALDIGYAPGVDKIRELNPKVLLLLGADECSFEKSDLPQDCFVIYQGTYSSR